MSDLIEMVIDGRPATVAYLDEIGGKLVPPEDAKVAIVVFKDDGEKAIYFVSEKPAP